MKLIWLPRTEVLGSSFRFPGLQQQVLGSYLNFPRLKLFSVGQFFEPPISFGQLVCFPKTLALGS